MVIKSRPLRIVAGAQPVVVLNEIGRGSFPIAIRRYAAILAPGSGKVGWTEVGPTGAKAAGSTPLANGRWLALSSDGRAAYVAEASGGMIDVIELPAPGATADRAEREPAPRATPRPGLAGGTTELRGADADRPKLA